MDNYNLLSYMLFLHLVQFEIYIYTQMQVLNHIYRISLKILSEMTYKDWAH